LSRRDAQNSQRRRKRDQWGRLAITSARPRVASLHGNPHSRESSVARLPRRIEIGGISRTPRSILQLLVFLDDFGQSLPKWRLSRLSGSGDKIRSRSGRDRVIRLSRFLAERGNAFRMTGRTPERCSAMRGHRHAR